MGENIMYTYMCHWVPMLYNVCGGICVKGNNNNKNKKKFKKKIEYCFTTMSNKKKSKIENIQPALVKVRGMDTFHFAGRRITLYHNLFGKYPRRIY